MKQKIGTIRFALTFTGCFLGAGYVSGQELWQYFGAFGRIGILAIILSIALIGAVTAVIMVVVSQIGTASLERIVIRWNIPWLRAVVAGMVEFMFFGVTCIMIAGIGALGNQLLGIPFWVGALCSVLFAAILAYFAFDGVVTVFSLSVPILVITAMVLIVIRLSSGTCEFSLGGKNVNPMLGTWYIAIFNYMSLNIVGSIGILSPIAENVKTKKSVFSGIAIGSLALACLGLGLLLTIATAPEATTMELPMLAVAAEIGRNAEVIYGALLFIAMLGNALATFVAVQEYIRSKSKFFKDRKLLLIALMAVALFVLSLAGFSGLVGTLYPIYGYFGLVMTILIFEHCIHNISKKKGEKDGQKRNSDGAF